MAKSSKSGKSSRSAKAPNVVAAARNSRGRKSGSSWLHWLWENAKSLAGALLIYFFIRTFLVEAYKIPSGSMIPTLLVGDWLFVNKAVYGPALPFSDIHLPGYSSPHRGDVVVFVSPYQADEAARGNDPTPTLVKRLIGAPGDTIYMRKGVVYVNGLARRQGFGAAAYTGDPAQSSPDETSSLFDWQKRIALENTRFGSAPADPTHDNWGPLLVPPGDYFMMGDNRYCSKDSRYWGVVPRANIRGRPMFVYYSYRPSPGGLNDCDGQTSDRPLSFLTDIRWGRLFHVIR
ncbi:MAG: signal peptidase I [Gemmatimonadaceae bacterium]|nr:signal peptidase I [Gemmatimonadaceae bacterium]